MQFQCAGCGREDCDFIQDPDLLSDLEKEDFEAFKEIYDCICAGRDWEDTCTQCRGEKHADMADSLRKEALEHQL